MDLAVSAAGVTAALLTLFDLDRTFYIPSASRARWELRAWWWGFVLANGALSILLFGAVGATTAFENIPPLFKGILVGGGYLALVRSKFATISIQGKDIPLGIEALYEGARGFVFRRINRIAQEERIRETTSLADEKSLEKLVAECRTVIEVNQIMTGEEKRLARAWILKVIEDAGSDDAEKRRTLANFRLSGQQSD